jgi:hypothetical protein
VLIGDDPASQAYVRNKIKKAEETGVRSPGATVWGAILDAMREFSGAPVGFGVMRVER